MSSSPVQHEDVSTLPPGLQKSPTARFKKPPKFDEDQKSVGGGTAVTRGTAPFSTFRLSANCPITQGTFIYEAKRIYSGLVQVEQRCIAISKQLSGSNEESSPEQWDILIKLHRRLLDAHQDFFLLSEDPSAPPVIKGLAEMYALPARLWRDGIYTFLELLHRRLPDSLEHILTFIHIAYPMMGLLKERVCAFEDTWIECLGDLARYRMAVDVTDCETWAGIARKWYNLAADRNPDVGRFQHQLALLADSNILQQLFYYTKSLVSVQPFPGARESISLFFSSPRIAPKVHRCYPAITAFTAAHGYLSNQLSVPQFLESAKEFLCDLETHISRMGATFKIQGVHISSCNFAAVLGYGLPGAVLSAVFHQGGLHHGDISRETHLTEEKTSFPSSDLHLFYGAYLISQTLTVVLGHVGNKNIYPTVHFSLAFLWCLARNPDGAIRHIETVVPWERIAKILNVMIRGKTDTERFEGGNFPTDEEIKQLPEDFLIRGQLWSQSYFPPHFFENIREGDEGRFIEGPSLDVERAYRCLWLGARIASLNRWMTYDCDSREFSTTAFASELEKIAQTHNPFNEIAAPVSWCQETSKLDLNSAARTSYQSQIKSPVILDPLGPGPGIKPSLSSTCRSLSQPDVLGSRERPPNRNTIKTRSLHGLLHSSSTFCGEAGVSFLLSPTNSSEHSEGLKRHLEQDRKPHSSSQLNGNHKSAREIKPSSAISQVIAKLDEFCAKRVRAREIRVALHHAREDEGKHRAALVKTLNMFPTQDDQSDWRHVSGSANALVEQLQSAIESSFNLEQMYHQEEDELDKDEYLLIKSMERLSESLLESPPGISEMNIPTERSYSDVDIRSHAEPLEYPPIVVDYLSRVGGAEILLERMTDLDSLWYNIIEIKKRRRSLNIPMDEESLHFLQSYDSSKTQVRKELSRTILDVICLRAECDDQGLPIKDYTGGLDYLYHIGRLNDVVIQSEDLLETSALDDPPSPFCEPGLKKLSSNMFVNKWILHQLRQSSLEIARLRSAPELQHLLNEGWDEAIISRLALALWFLDDAVRSWPATQFYDDDYDYTGIAEERRALDSDTEHVNITRPLLPERNSDDVPPNKEIYSVSCQPVHSS